MLDNAGQMISYGAELALNLVPVKTKDWTWTTTPTLSFNRNIITKLSNPEKGYNYTETTTGGVSGDGLMNTQTQLLVEGNTVGAFYGYHFYKIMEDGTWLFWTPNGDNPEGGRTDEPDLSQRQFIGNAQPIFTFGWNNTIRWKNLDVSMFFRGVYGNDILNLTRWTYGPSASQSTNVFMKDITKDNVTYTNKEHFSDFYLEDGSYIKLDNLTVGYTFKLRENKYVDKLRVYLTGQNLFTITKYSGIDPEVNTTSVWSSGIDDCSFYPSITTVLLGVNLTLF